MSQSDHNEFLDALSMNREIEFTYKSISYAIVYHKEGWCLVDQQSNLSKYYETNNELLNDVNLDGKKIEHLIQTGEIRIEMIL